MENAWIGLDKILKDLWPFVVSVAVFFNLLLLAYQLYTGEKEKKDTITNIMIILGVSALILGCDHLVGWLENIVGSI